MARTRTFFDVATGQETTVEIPPEEAAVMWPEPGQIVKVWPNVEFFVQEFTPVERGQIEVSTNLEIASLRFELKTWFSTVRTDDPRVQNGLALLVSEGILTPERALEIVAPPPD